MANLMYENTCRICFQKQETLFSLFWKRNGLSPYDKLIKHTKIKIDINTGGPSSICLQCLTELDTTVNFLFKCEKSNELLETGRREFESQSTNFDIEKDIYSDVLCDVERKEEQEIKLKEEFLKEEVEASASVPVSQCVECGKSTKRCPHKVSTSATYTCDHCQKVFTRKFNFTLHVKRHLGERNWPCAVCGVSQLTRWLAQQHCTPRKRRMCPYTGCGKSFTTNTNLNTHIRVHNGDRAHVCTECGKGFFCKNTLNDHLRIHTGEKPYICPICGKRFRTNKLSVHVATHAGRRPHVCPAAGCARAFRSGRALRQHAHTHAAPRRLPCAACPALYSHTQSLAKHVRKHHQQKPTQAVEVSNPTEFEMT